jgi:hypothetical protein
VSKSGEIRRARDHKSQSIHGLVFHLNLHHIHPYWHLIPGATFERSTRPLLLNASPLLEDKWDFDSQALISNISGPFTTLELVIKFVPVIKGIAPNADTSGTPQM